jgi:hypothetical protein
MVQQTFFGTSLDQPKRARELSRIGTVKRAFTGAVVALVLVSGSLAGASAKAGSPAEAGSAGGSYTETTSSPDGKVVFICTYDDVTGDLLFCDVLYFPAKDGGKDGKKKR